MSGQKRKANGAVSSLTKLRTVMRELFPVAAKKYPAFFPLEGLKTLCDVLIPFAAIFISPMIIDELAGEGRLERLFLYAAVLIVLELILNTVKSVVNAALCKYQERLNDHFTALISEHCMKLDYQLTEDKDALDQLEKANTGMDWYSGGVFGLAEQLFMLIGNIIKLGGYVTVILMHAPLLVPVIFAGVLLCGIFYMGSNNVEVATFARMAHNDRMFKYYGWEMADFRYGKDIRLYEASDLLLGKWDDLTESQISAWSWRSEKQCKYSLCIVLISVVGTTFNCFYAAQKAIRGFFSLGTFSQVIEAAGALNDLLQGLVGNVTELIKRSNYAYEYCVFMRYPQALPKGDKSVSRGKHEIEFRNVCFSYPSSDVKVLDGVSLTIKEGERLSLVGLNGAGKSTLVKLLCRFYDPTEGCILLDGTDIRELDHEEYIKQFAAVFQDFMLLAFSVNENIALTENDELSDEQRSIIKDLLEKAGLKETLNKLPQGADSLLFKYFDEGGTEPSGGEQQKLALARALYKDAPIVILDEPTSALDPLAEYEIYSRFNELIEGKTALYISHRLSSCRFCDRIAVFHQGKVSEYGTHEELVEIPNGIYREMFEAQAGYYV